MPAVVRDWFSRVFLALAGFLLVASADAAPLPACAPPVEVSAIKVIRVERNGVLVLSDGRAVDVEGILLPADGHDHAPSFLVRQAVAVLGDLTREGFATLAVGPPKEDRYGRLRAQVFFLRDETGPWLQAAMLRRGLARVNIAPDRRECAAALYAVEREARAARAGIWALSAYAVRTSEALGGDTGTFQIVEGDVKSAEVRGGRAYLNFGNDWRTDFTVTISTEDIKTFRHAGVDPRGYAGLRVRVRGWIESMNGPEIEIATPDAIEVLGPVPGPTPASDVQDKKRPG